MKIRSFRRSRWPLDNRRSHRLCHRDDERGVTMILVAVSMVALIAMAALSIDVVTLYLDREETQRAADAAALAAARVISISGITGTTDPDTDTIQWQAICGGTGTATQVAQQVGAQNGIGGVAGTVTVTYSVAGAASGSADCSGLSQAFAINPTVLVKVTRTGLPTMFSRIWSRGTNTVSASAAAEVFNPSDSAAFTPGGDIIPVTPRCVKPWIVPDEDPVHSSKTTFKRFLGRRSGRILTAGIAPIDNGVIGESFLLQNNCTTPGCYPLTQNPPTPTPPPGPVGYYVPALVTTTAPGNVAVPSCATGDFQSAIAGCDEGTVYACGTVSGATADLSQNRNADVQTAVQCLTNLPSPGNDTIDTTTYPFQIRAGASNPIAAANQFITSSNSIMTLPLYDDYLGTGGPQSLSGTNPTVTIVGFLQVFVSSVDANGNMNVTVLNVAGCGDNASTTQSANGSSPLPIRLITPQ